MHTLFEFVTYTKSVEYLIAVGFLLLFVAFWRYINTSPVAARRTATAPSLASRLADYVGGFLVPDQTYFHPGHAWVRAESGDVLTVGIDDFGQKLVGKIDTLRLPKVGQRLSQGEPAWELGAAGEVFNMLSPVSGEVVEVNPNALWTPWVVNQDPFGDGWLLKVRTPRKTATLRSLLGTDLAKRWIEDARARLLVQPRHENLGRVLADVGPARDGIARALDNEHWGEIVREFFLTAEDEHETRSNP